jgi:hypothetical protein
MALPIARDRKAGRVLRLLAFGATPLPASRASRQANARVERALRKAGFGAAKRAAKKPDADRLDAMIDDIAPPVTAAKKRYLAAKRAGRKRAPPAKTRA